MSDNIVNSNNTDNNISSKDSKFLENLGYAKNAWTLMHDVASQSKILSSNKYAKIALMIQSNAGGVIVDTARGDTWDEQVVGFVGDFIGSTLIAFFVRGRGDAINNTLTATDNHLGSHLKNALKSMKLYDKENSYTYTYKKDFQAMVGGQLQKVPYAKVPINRNGEMVTTPTHQPLYYTSNEAEYNHYETIKNSVKEKEISELSFKEICDFFAVLNTPMSSEYNKALKYNNDKQELIEDKQTLYEIFSAYASENGIDAETSLSPFSEKLHSFIKEAISTIFSLKNIYVVSISSDGTNNISKINKALKKREENSEFKAGNKEEILLICPYHSAQIIAPYQPKNTKLTIILADKTYLDCVNLNPQGSKDESKLILTNYKFNPYEANSKEEDIKFVDSATSGDVTLYKDSNNKFISQDKKYSYDGSKVTLNFFNNLNFNLLNFAKENGFSLRGDKSSAMFDVRLKLADKEESKPTTNSGNCNLIVKNLIITDENLNSSDIKEIYLHNCEDKRVYRSCSLEKNDNDEADKNSYTAKFNINLILDKDQSVFKRTTKFILAYRDLSKDYSTSDIHSMSDNGVISLEAKKKAEGSITYDLKTSLIEVANNITGVVVDIQNIDQTTIQDTINLKAVYKPNKGDDNYKEVNWSYKIIKQGEYNKEVKSNFVANDIKLEGEKFKGKEISFTPQTDIKDQKLLDKLKEGDSTLVFFAYLKAPRYTTRYGKTHGRVDFKVPMKLKYENNKLYIYEFDHTDKNLGFDASLSNKFACEINEVKGSTNFGGKYFISSSINSQSIGIFRDHKLKDPAYQVISNNGKSSRVLFEIYASDNKIKSAILGNKDGINLINNENKSKFISKFNEIKQKVKLQDGESVSIEVIEDNVCFCLSQGLVKKSCGGNGCNINDNDYEIAAKELGIEKEVLMAIAKQESKGSSFQAVKQATILFERHKMYSLLIKKGNTKASVDALSIKHPSIVNKNSGGYNDMTSYDKLKTAKSIDYDCAVQSCSWGKFQVMGFHYANLYSSPRELEKAMNMCELQQFKYFVLYLKKTNGMVDALKNKNWEGIATLYNGSKWKEKNPEYANNVKKYYNQFKASK
ncbi:N-acetylmuramidase domain-containing protein [Campylobacter concisus]|uniref:N-acetylmuramidase domain-containing protein n=1 Tax=Campylobacter concisus TaxID=199 RepID=UPI000CD9BA1F|nr:N-acetylmuramidase domain-containing protein [Campylobacter concisus]